MGLLDDILAQKKQEVSALRTADRPSRPASWPLRDVAAALRRSPGQALRLIAEIKFRSPSAGLLSRALDAGRRARAYELGGASMVSVLTDGRWFDGSLGDLQAAREQTSLPLLCKDFVIDLAQVEQAWSAGADAVLLIVRCLQGPGQLRELVEGTRERGLEPFVEVVDETELTQALSARARVIGVNARDLDTLEMDAKRAERVLASLPPDIVAVHLSGLKTPQNAGAIARSRADAALIGEALMRRDDPRELLQALVAGAQESPGPERGEN